MAKWVNSDVLDGGLNQVKNNATKYILIKAYALGDSYATVIGNAVATATVNSTNFTLSGAANNPRLLTTSTASATAAANSGATPDLHLAFTDGTSKVLWVTDETTDQQVVIGNTVNFPALVLTFDQPI